MTVVCSVSVPALHGHPLSLNPATSTVTWPGSLYEVYPEPEDDSSLLRMPHCMGSHCRGFDGEVMLNGPQMSVDILGTSCDQCRSTGSINLLRPRKPEGSLGRTAQDVHLDSHTAPELWVV